MKKRPRHFRVRSRSRGRQRRARVGQYSRTALAKEFCHFTNRCASLINGRYSVQTTTPGLVRKSEATSDELSVLSICEVRPFWLVFASFRAA